MALTLQLHNPWITQCRYAENAYVVLTYPHKTVTLICRGQKSGLIVWGGVSRPLVSGEKRSKCVL